LEFNNIRKRMSVLLRRERSVRVSTHFGVQQYSEKNVSTSKKREKCTS